MDTRRLMEAKLGKTIYSITFYEKVKRAVIPIGKDGDFVLMVSFDNEADSDFVRIMEQKTKCKNTYSVSETWSLLLASILHSFTNRALQDGRIMHFR
jgi:hypothetical protein